MTGSLRQRGPDSWELRVYLGIDADTGRERWATKTVHGSRRHATASLTTFVEEAGYARLRAGTVADLLDRWLAHASPAWSTTTLRQTRSVIEHHLKPTLGHLAVNRLTTVVIVEDQAQAAAGQVPRAVRLVSGAGAEDVVLPLADRAGDGVMACTVLCAMSVIRSTRGRGMVGRTPSSRG